jgi:hypothetical protein
MAYVSFLPFLMMPFFGLKNNAILWISIIFAFIIILSGFVNHTPLILIILYLQNAITPYVIYYMVTSYLHSGNITRIFKWCIIIACIQLPIVILQRAFYEKISQYGSRYVLKEDFGFGTFYTSNDPALAFFVFGLILFLLFDHEHNHIVRRRKLLIGWLVLTILVLNSKISLVILTLIFGYYFLRRLQLKTILVSIFSIAAAVFIAWKLITLNPQISENVNGLFNLVQSWKIDPATARKNYLQGHGNRAYALVYLLSQPINLLGNGPFFSLDPFTKVYHRGGDSGHLVNFYINLGIIGLLTGYALAFSLLKSKPFSQFVFLYFLVMCTFFLTVEIFIDGSILMAFHIFAGSYLIPNRRIKEPVQIDSVHLLTLPE